MSPVRFSVLSAVLIGSCGPVVDHAEEEEKRQRVAALYADAGHAEKCEAIFKKLRAGLKPGMTSAQAARSLDGKEWMQHTRSDQVMLLAGWIPVDIGFEKRAYWMNLHPDSDGWSNYTVYFSIACPEDSMESFSITEFLAGEVRSSKFRLHQFALCHPGASQGELGRYEIIPKPKDDPNVPVSR